MSDQKTTETLDKLYLEWSNLTQAKTREEIYLQSQIDELTQKLRDIADCGSWAKQAALVEVAIAYIDNREVEEWANDTLAEDD